MLIIYYPSSGRNIISQEKSFRLQTTSHFATLYA